MKYADKIRAELARLHKRQQQLNDAVTNHIAAIAIAHQQYDKVAAAINENIEALLLREERIAKRTSKDLFKHAGIAEAGVVVAVKKIFQATATAGQVRETIKITFGDFCDVCPSFKPAVLKRQLHEMGYTCGKPERALVPVFMGWVYGGIPGDLPGHTHDEMKLARFLTFHAKDFFF